MKTTVKTAVWRLRNFFRIRDDQGLLEQELSGYRAYEQRVHYRLQPYVW